MASKNDKYIQDLIKSIRSKATTEIPEKQAYDPAKQAAGLEARLEGSGIREDKRDTRNIVEKALNLTPNQNVLFDVFEIINRPQQMLFQGIKAAQEDEDVFKAVRKGFGGVGEDVQFKEILHNAGMEDSEKSFGADDVLGFAGDVLADPIDLALVVATPFTGGASGALVGAKRAIQAADNAVDTVKGLDTALTLAKNANKTAEVAHLTKQLQRAQKQAAKLQESKKLWQNLETAATNLTELKKVAKKTGNTDGLADALTAYKRAVQPLKKRMTPLEFTFKKVKGGLGKSIDLADDGITGVLTKLDGVIDDTRIKQVQKALDIDVKEARKLQEKFNAIRPWSTKYADMKAAVNGIFDAAKAIPKGLWNKTKELTGGRKLAVARMSKLQLENVQDIAKVAKDMNLDPDDVSRMLMRNYEYMKHKPDMKFADMFDETYINNNPMTEQNYQAFKAYIRETFKDQDGFSKYSEAAIDDLFTVKPIKEGSELKIWLPKQDGDNKKYLKEMLDDVNRDFAKVSRDTEKFGKRFERLQEKYNKLQETQAKALEYINKNSNRFATIDGKTVAILTSDELSKLKKLGIDLKPDKNGVVTYDSALKRINARIKNAEKSLAKIDAVKVDYADLKDEAAKIVLPNGKPDLAAMGKRGRTFLPDDESQKVINKKVASKWGTEDATAEVIKKRVDDGGITVINGKAIDADKGYQVAYDKTKEVPVDTIDDVLKYVKENNVQSYGVWYNDKANKYVIDTTSTYTEDAYAAAAAGLFGEQDAVMSWADLAKGDYDNAFKSPDDFADTFVKKTEPTNVGYHRGDLGKSEFMSQQYGSNRGTGHFGTGTYFTSSDSLGGTYSYGDRPLKKVNFDGYNLFKPKTEADGLKLHEGLKELNKIDSEESLKAWLKETSELSYDDDLNLITVRKTVEKLPDKILELKKILGVSDEQFDKAIKKVKATFEKYKKLSQKGLTKEELQMIADGRMFNTAIYDIIDGKDSLSTVFMKALGFEGIDVRTLKRLDDDGFGSVIYDLRKADDITDAGKIKVGKVQMTPEQAKKSLTSLRDKMVKAKDDVTKSKKELAQYISDASGEKLTKQANKMKELQDNLRPIVHDRVIPASRYYDGKDVLEMQEYFKAPEMEELYKRFDERHTAMFQDLNDLLGTALDGEGYMRHVLNDEYAQELRNLPKNVQTKLRDSGIIGNTSTFRGRAYQMSAHEANLVRKQITQNMLETGKYSDGSIVKGVKTPNVKEVLESLVDLDMFEVDAVSSTWDFIRNAPKEIEKGRRIEETLKASLANGVAGTLLDPEMLKPFEAMVKFENGKMITLVDTSRQTLVSANDLYNKIDELGYAFQNEKLMQAIKSELQASKASQLVIDKNLYNLIGFTTDKTINEVAENTVKLIDKTNNMFKKFKLLSPGFQIRNLVGNFTNILLSGVNPYKIMDNNILAHRVLAQGDALMTKRAKNIPLSAGELELLDLFESFTKEGFDQIIGATDMANIASVYDIPEDIAKMMRKGSEKSKNPLKNLMAWNARANELVDRQFRMSAYIYAQRNPEILAKVGVDTPAEFVRKVLFDPNDLSKVEQQYLKRLIPFYTFTKKNLAYQMRNVWDNPNRYNKLMKSVDSSWSMLDIDPKTDLEQYKRENMWIPVFVNQNGEYKALKANLPVADFGEFMSDPMKKIVSSTAPAIRTPFELTMNTQAFTQMPIQEFKGQRGYQLPFVGRKVEYGLSQLGLDVPIAAGYDLAKGAGQVAQGNVGQGLETGVGRSFLSSGSVEKARLSADYQRLNDLRDLMKYYKQEGKKILTLDEIANMQQDKSQSIIQRIRAIGRG